jgi:hypothetical protein
MWGLSALTTWYVARHQMTLYLSKHLQLLIYTWTQRVIWHINAGVVAEKMARNPT